MNPRATEFKPSTNYSMTENKQQNMQQNNQENAQQNPQQNNQQNIQHISHHHFAQPSAGMNTFLMQQHHPQPHLHQQFNPQAALQLQVLQQQQGQFPPNLLNPAALQAVAQFAFPQAQLPIVNGMPNFYPPAAINMSAVNGLGFNNLQFNSQLRNVNMAMNQPNAFQNPEQVQLAQQMQQNALAFLPAQQPNLINQNFLPTAGGTFPNFHQQTQHRNSLGGAPVLPQFQHHQQH